MLDLQESAQVSGGHDVNAPFSSNAMAYLGMVAGGVAGGIGFSLLTAKNGALKPAVVGPVILSAISSATTCVMIGMGKQYIYVKDTSEQKD
jgi:hypothetical protein